MILRNQLIKATSDLFNAAISTPNIIPTALVVFVLLYWLVVILGAIDIDFFDFDVDPDAEADVDGEISVTWLNWAAPRHVLAFLQSGPGSLYGIYDFSDYSYVADLSDG